MSKYNPSTKQKNVQLFSVLFGNGKLIAKYLERCLDMKINMYCQLSRPNAAIGYICGFTWVGQKACKSFYSLKDPFIRK